MYMITLQCGRMHETYIFHKHIANSHMAGTVHVSSYTLHVYVYSE